MRPDDKNENETNFYRGNYNNFLLLLVEENAAYSKHNA